MGYMIRPIIAGCDQKGRETVIFAARELQKYLSAVSGGDFSIIPTANFDKLNKNTVYMGVDLSDTLPKVENPELDDAIQIDVKEFTGVITGTNARSVLIATYRYLKELGFAFIRPGLDGEYYPETLEWKNVSVCEKASYRHRTVCMEGSVLQKTVTDMIDWLPKAAMNGYYVQFQLPREFFDRWYSEDTPYREKETLSDDDIRAMVSLGEEEIKKRSLLYHGVGHGWTSQAFGIDGSSWSVHEEPEPEYRDVVAMINGERKLWNGVPINTNLCYSNPKARNRVTDNVVQYCLDHPELSYVHFWLGDGMNNNCECENCRGKRTSDYYVQMLNELDEKLTKAKLNTRIVFLIYFDLLWKPLYERLSNSDRFVLMFAPISRSYSASYDPNATGEMRPYELNQLKFPKNVGENLAYLRDWQQDFKCDGFDYDYYFMWDHYFDFAQYRHAQIICEDIKNLEAIGLNGLVSCQIQRAFLPSSLNMNVMAETLWNKTVDFDTVSDRVMKTEFGENYGKVQQYLSSLSQYGCAKALRGEEEVVTEKTVNDLTLAIQIIDEFKPVIEKELEETEHRSAWEKLEFHATLYRMMLEVYLTAAKGNLDDNLEHIKEFVLKNELRFKDEFDAMYFLKTFIGSIVGNLKNRREYIF